MGRRDTSSPTVQHPWKPHPSQTTRRTRLPMYVIELKASAPESSSQFGHPGYKKEEEKDPVSPRTEVRRIKDIVYVRNQFDSSIHPL